MNQKEITSNIALKLGTTQKSVDDCLNALNEEIISALKTEGRVQINLGVFELKNRAARVARVPGTDRTVDVPAKRVPTFKPSKNLKSSVL